MTKAMEGTICEAGGESVRVHWYTVSKQSGKRMRRMCAGTLVHHEQAAREEDEASTCRYTGTL